MTRFEMAELDTAPGWRELLAAYHTAAETVAEPQADGWLPRREVVEGIDKDLSLLHGRLIAVGLLKFELIDRTAGLRYRVTPEGRRVLAGDVSEGDDD